MRFLFVSPEICLHLPSDSTPRWTPLVFRYILPTTGQIRDLNPLEYALARHTSMETTRKFTPHLNDIAITTIASILKLAFPYRKSIQESSSWFHTPIQKVILLHRYSKLQVD
ncbi:MAG: hypothetical protein WCS73_05675 [Lentisphaeria bacterium]